MQFPEKTIQLKDGRSALLRAPIEQDAAEMLRCMKQCSTETEFLLRSPEDWVETIEKEAAILKGIVDSATTLMLVCVLDGEIVGNCSLSMNVKKKIKHRASVGIAILEKCWNLGIGTAMFREMIDAARAQGVMQLELEFIEGNDRGRRLYEKMGFQTVSYKPNAICKADGSLCKEFFMVKPL